MLIRAATLLILVAIAYIPACQGDFIWDDDQYVSENEVLAQPGGLRDIWLKPTATPQYYPLVFTTFWIEYRLWGLNPAGYHWVNVFFHGLNAVLLWLLLRRLQVPLPWLAAAIFALHPVHVESVAWITERKNVLSGFFYLVAFLAFLRFSPPETPASVKGQWGWYAASLLAFLAALLSKSVTCSLPAVLVLVIWWKRGWPTRREWLALAPMFALGLVLAMHTSYLERTRVGASGRDWDFTAVERCLIAGRALWFYVGKLLWPHPLIFNYPRWHIDATEPWQYLFPLGVLVVFVILALPLTRLPLPRPWASLRRLGRGPLVACLVFAGTLLPALGFFNVYPMIYYFAADHFQYLASIAMICLFTAAVHLLGDGWRWLRGIEGKFLAVSLLAGLGLLTWRQGHVYRNLDSLWTDTLTKNPEAWLAHYNLGTKRVAEGNYTVAMQCFERALRINPRLAVAYNNWGLALLREGEWAQHQADKARSQENLKLEGELRLQAKSKFELSREKLKMALLYDPAERPVILFLMGTVQGRLENYDLAIGYFEKGFKALETYQLEKLEFLRGRYEFEFAQVLLKAGRVREAIEQLKKAVEREQEVAEYRQLLDQAEKLAKGK